MSGNKIKDDIRKRFITVVDQLSNGDLTKEEIMKTVGDYAQGYTQMNSGRRYPTLNNVVLICQHYGVNANWLLFGMGESGLETAINPLKRLQLMEQEIQQLKMIFASKKRNK